MRLVTVKEFCCKNKEFYKNSPVHIAPFGPSLCCCNLLPNLFTRSGLSLQCVRVTCLPTVFCRSGKKNSFDGDKPVTLRQTNLVEFCCKQCSIPCHCDLKIKYQHTIKKYSTSSDKLMEKYLKII